MLINELRARLVTNYFFLLHVGDGSCEHKGEVIISVYSFPELIAWNDHSALTALDFTNELSSAFNAHQFGAI